MRLFIFDCGVLFLMTCIYITYQTRTLYESRGIGRTSMLDRKGNMSWVLDLVLDMNPENPARKKLLSKLRNQGVNKQFLKALQSEIPPKQKQILQ